MFNGSNNAKIDVSYTQPQSQWTQNHLSWRQRETTRGRHSQIQVIDYDILKLTKMEKKKRRNFE